MLENIRRIGIFMIAAQTVVHFAAGKQYEKYIKIIAGVIVLLLFLSPFVSSSDEILAKWEAEAERMMDILETGDGTLADISYGKENVQRTVVQRIEEEIKSRFNEMISGEPYYVTAVELELEDTSGTAADEGKTGADRWSLACVRVTLAKRGESGEDYPAPGGGGEDAGTGEAVPQILVEEIRVGLDGEMQGTAEAGGGRTEEEAEREEGGGEQLQEYRKRFAQALGLSEDRVEVTESGGR